MLSLSNRAIRAAASYAEERRGLAKWRFYVGLFGLVGVSLAFAGVTVYAVVADDSENATAAGIGTVLMASVAAWRVRTWSTAAEQLSEGDNRTFQEGPLIRYWFLVLLVGAIGVVGFGIWEIQEGRRGAGLGYVTIAVLVILIVAIIQAHGRRRP